MSLALLVPAGLAALAALLVPLLLHLARRSEQRTTDFAALRWLAPNTRPRRKRRFDERLLLLLRLLLLVALALLLAQPVLYGADDRTPWMIVAPGVPASTARAVAGNESARLHWLAVGFPSLDAPAPPRVQPLASLLRELDATLPAGAPLTVLVPAALDGADAQRPRLVRAVDWRVVPAVEDSAHPAQTVHIPPLALDVRARPDAQGLRYLHAAGVAWQARAEGTQSRAAPAARSASSVRVADPAQPLPSTAHPLAWLIPGPLPDALHAWVRSGGSVLLSSDVRAPGMDAAAPAWHDEHGEPLVRTMRLGRGRLLQFTRPLAPATMPQLLEADFPERLRDLFAPAVPAPARVSAGDYAPTVGAAPYPRPPRPLASWLVVTAALLFALERWLACGPRRELAR
ncbi:MAG: hypothetical protein HOQ02_08890 [Lysobacter sp.]|nr:hypothetical protein [Lysobacter sp.]